MDVLTPVESWSDFRQTSFSLITPFSLLSYTGVACIHMSLALQTLPLDTRCHKDVWYHSQCPSASHLLCLLLSGTVSLSLLLFLDCDPLKSPVRCFAALLLWCLFGGAQALCAGGEGIEKMCSSSFSRAEGTVLAYTTTLGLTTLGLCVKFVF